MKRKICIVTGSRADYGLLYWLMKEVEEDDNLELQIIATCMHLSPQFGLTYKVIEKDGFKINEKVEMLTEDDSACGITSSVGTATIGFAGALDRLKPDVMVVLGDRYESLAACSAALIMRIPIAHIHGGELTKGAYDESIRHSITKMAHLHFVSTEVYGRRVIQMGEEPERVFCYGAPGIDSIKRLNLLGREDFEESVGFKLGEKNILSTFHPATLDEQSPSEQFKELLTALDNFIDSKIIFSYPNAEVKSLSLVEMLEDYAAKNKGRVLAVKSLGQIRYLSAIKNVDVVVGNSSSGIIEVPSFRIPTVNIGDRQEGRIMPDTVICCEPKSESITESIEKALSKEFRDSIKTAINPYGDGDASSKIKCKLKEVVLCEDLIKKNFYDIQTHT